MKTEKQSTKAFTGPLKCAKKLEISHKKEPSVTSTVTQVLPQCNPALGNFLSVGQVADALGVTRKTVLEWCKSGSLPAILKPYGKKTTFLISANYLDVLKARSQEAIKKEKVKKYEGKGHQDLIPLWMKAMERGLMNGKPFSQATMQDYAYYLRLFFQKHSILSIGHLKAELMRISPAQFSKRDHYYKALLCFGKYLIREGVLEEDFLQEVKGIRPKRHLPPKRFTVTEEGLQSLLEACEAPEDRMLVTLLANTGLRATEACSLRLSDIDLAKGVLKVRCGKGGKARSVGLNPSVIESVQACLSQWKGKRVDQTLFLDKVGKPMHRHGLYQRLERIGKKARVKVSPHALRRCFVTLRANQGRPLQMLQMACGHSDIKTTRSYCLTTETEVIEAMKAWD